MRYQMPILPTAWAAMAFALRVSSTLGLTRSLPSSLVRDIYAHIEETLLTLDPVEGDVSWTDMTSGDGVKNGFDSNGIWYMNDAIDLYIKRIEKTRRTGVFWSGGATTEEDFSIVDEFIEINLKNDAVKADTVFPYSDFENMKLDGSNKDNLWWRAIIRMSKGAIETP